jgi:YVTN family beta-propeller protein
VTRTLIGGVGAGFVTLTPDGKKAYVSNEDGLNISVLDTVTGAQIATVPMPVSGGESVSPYSSVLSPDGGRLYTLVAYPGFPTFLVAIDTATNAVVFDDQVDATASLPLAISADGGTLYMCGGRIEIFDVATQQVTGTAPIPSSANGPHGFAVSPDRAYAIVTANEYTGNFGQFALVDLNTKTIVKQIGFPQYEVTGPAVFSPDGSLAYFTSYQKASHQARVQVFDMASRTIAKTFPASGADAIAVTPDGSEIEVGNSKNATVVAMNGATGAVIGKTATPGMLVSITVSPDGQRIYVPDYESSMVQVVEPESGQIVGQIPAGHLEIDTSAVLRTSANGALSVLTGTAGLTIIDNVRQQIAGVVPMARQLDLALAPGGNVAYAVTVANPQQWVVAVKTHAAKVAAAMQIPAGQVASYLALAADGKTLYLSGKTCPAQGSCVAGILVVDTATLKIAGQIPTPNCSLLSDIAITKDGSTAYVGCEPGPFESAVAMIDLAQQRVLGAIPLLTLFPPTELALAPDQRLLYAIDLDDSRVSVIDTQQQALIATLFGSTSLINPAGVAVSPDSQLVYVTDSIFHVPMTVITAPPNGLPQISGTIAMPAPSTGVAFGILP